MMDGPALLGYDSRSMSSGPLQRPVMASPQYVMNNNYTTAGPMASMAAPAYDPQSPFGYTNYTPSSPAVTPAFQQQYTERPTPRVMPSAPEVDRGLAYPRDCTTHEQSQSPSLKSEPMSGVKSRNNSTATSKVVKSNGLVKNANEATFSTDIDILMKAIQTKKEQEELARGERIPSPQSDHDISQDIKQAQKRYRCDFEDCGYSADQKTHLDIHWRTHTGEKPYICKYPGCNSKFTQHGNLKTHENRHTGHKPYPCPECGKKFAQRGNVRAHLHTHSQTKPFCCILDNCYKRFTQRGNLKQHQNKFHEGTVKKLASKFATMEHPETATKADQDLWQYFAALYKNSNKGIKGRGKNRNVGPVARASPVASNHGMSSQYPVLQPHQAQMPPPTHHHGLSHPAAYSMSRGPPGLNMMVGPDGLPAHRDAHSYEMYDDTDSINGSGTASTMSGTMYDEDHGRTDLGFNDRMY